MQELVCGEGEGEGGVGEGLGLGVGVGVGLGLRKLGGEGGTTLGEGKMGEYEYWLYP